MYVGATSFSFSLSVIRTGTKEKEIRVFCISGGIVT
jgi:hypothetical protein